MDIRGYLKHFLILFSGTMFSQLLNFGAYPVLSRQYIAEDFGVFAIFLTSAVILGAITCGRYDVVVQACHPKERFAVFSLSQDLNRKFTLGLFVVASIVAVFLQDTIGWIYLAFLPLCTFLIGYTTAAFNYLLKQEEYKTNSLGQVLRTGGAVVAQIALFYLLPKYWGLITGFTLGLLAQSLYFNWKIKQYHPVTHTTFEEQRQVFKKYIRYFKVDVPSQIISALSLNLLNYLLLFLYTESEVGHYSLAYRLAALPLTLFANSLAQVFFQKASKRYVSEGTFWDEIKFNLLSSSGLAVLAFLIIYFLAIPVTSWYLGDSWVMVGQIMVYIAPMLALRLVSVSIATAPLVYGEPKILLINNLASLIALLSVFGIALYESWKIDQFLITGSAISSLISVMFISYVLFDSRRRSGTGKVLTH